MVNFDDIDNVENRPENGEMKSRLDCGNMSFTFSHARDAVVGKCPNTRGRIVMHRNFSEPTLCIMKISTVARYLKTQLGDPNGRPDTTSS